VYTVIVTPVILGFHFEEDSSVKWFHNAMGIFINIMYFADIFISLRTPIMSKKGTFYITNTRELGASYLRKYFIYD
jgi:hypothetical protein